LIVIYAKQKRIVSYDSLGRDRTLFLNNNVLDWYNKDSMDKLKRPVGIHNWDKANGICPKQRNCYDCGVHLLVNADYISDNLALDYSLNEIAMWRAKIAYSLLKKQILH
jgi:Ulp1 family protease